MRIAAALLFAALAAQAQSLGGVYKVHLTMRDAADASAKSGRQYTILIDTHGRGSFRIGSREPVATGNSQWSYLDTGVNIDCRLEEVNNTNKLQLSVDMDISTIIQRDKGAAPAPPNPTIGQLKVNITALVSPDKATQVASIDDPVTNRKFDVQALVTKAD